MLVNMQTITKKKKERKKEGKKERKIGLNKFSQN